MSISVTELSAEQASKIGLSGLVMGVDVAGTKLAIGNFPTNIYRAQKKTSGHSTFPGPVEMSTTGKTDLFTYDPKSGTYSSTKYFDNAGTIKSLTITGRYTYRLYLDFAPTSAIDITVINGDPNNIAVNFNSWKGPKDNTKNGAKKLIKNFINFKLDEEGALLMQASEVIVSAGTEVSKILGEKYKALASEIALNIKNFQGKTIRNIDQAMITLNRILANPKMKIRSGDKTTLLNAWKKVNATDMANKFGYLGKVFTSADIIMKVEKLRQKSIMAIDTGDWKPVLLEVESWILSGMATGFALSILASLSMYVAATFGLPVTTVTVVGVIGIAMAASLIDDKLADKINNWVISSAH